MKICVRCKENKEDSLFGKSSKNRDGLHSWCKACVSKSRMRRYYENHSVERKNGNERNKIAYQINMTRLYEYLKDNPCIDCGEDDPIVLEFDHIDQETKINTVNRIAQNNWLWDKVQIEIDKCQIRCANCHARRTAKQLNYYAYIK